MKFYKKMANKFTQNQKSIECIKAHSGDDHLNEFKQPTNFYEIQGLEGDNDEKIDKSFDYLNHIRCQENVPFQKTTITIQYENIDTFPIHDICNIDERIIILNISFNLIKHIQPHIFSKFPNLKICNCEGNLIEILPDSICNLIHLEELIMDSNRLEYLPNKISELRKLKKISVSNNKLVFIPATITNLVDSLEYLYLHKNKITFLCLDLGLLKNLKQLYIHSNYFYKIPTSLCQLQYLS